MVGDGFAMPGEWLRHCHPRRGLASSATVTLDERNVETAKAASESAEFRDRLERAIAYETSDARLAEAGRAYLAGAVDPLGAAVAMVLAPYDRGDSLADFADLWVAEHGVVFAVRAVCALLEAELCHVPTDLRSVWDLELRRPERPEHNWHHSAIATATRVRALLAAASAEDYLAATEVLAELRCDDARRVLAAYLVPTRQDWVEQVLAESQLLGGHVFGRMVACSVSTTAQVAALPGNALGEGELHTVLEAVGPAIAPYAAKLGAYDVLAALPTDEAFGLLLARCAEKAARELVRTRLAEQPLTGLRLLARSNGLASAMLFHPHALACADLVATADLPADVRAKVEEVCRGRVADAPGHALPPVLADPPWLRERSADVRLSLKVPDSTALQWQPGEREAWRDVPRWVSWQQHWETEEFAAGGLRAEDERRLVVNAPEDLVRPLLASWRPTGHQYVEQTTKLLAARFGLDALPVLLHFAKTAPVTSCAALLPFRDRGIAHLMANWLVHGRGTRPVAQAWFARHGTDGLVHLVPTAFGKPGKERRTAELALHQLAGRGMAERIREAGRRAGAEHAVAGLLATDPLVRAAAVVPELPEWVNPAILPQIRLRGHEGALSAAATRNVATVFALSTVEEQYPGLPLVRAACDPESLAGFAWRLFEQWRLAGHPMEHNWALTVLGWVGTDDTAARLAPVIRAWPGESGHQRAVLGLDLLARIGTDAALAQLSSIALKVKFKALRERAVAKVDEVAAELGLSAERLGDRLVPDLGLDEHGSLRLDYGTRVFTVGFDERLTPYVLDGDGKRRRDLPKPGAQDDPELAPAAHKRFGQLKKDVRALAGEQLPRLERAMGTRRRWGAGEFRALFLGHPLLCHLARRLVWLVEHDGQVLGGFRVTEERTLVDEHDQPRALPEDARVGIAHPVELTGNWGEVFARHGIPQPFPQLDRPVHALTEDERARGELPRFHGVTVPVGRLLGLTRKGWVRGTPLDAGVERWISRPVPGGFVVLDLDPGIVVGEVDFNPEQTIRKAFLAVEETSHCLARLASRDFPDLDPVTASEVLADLVGIVS